MSVFSSIYSMSSSGPTRISVYITSYNQKAYLIEAIESVLGQTLQPVEIIIVDDCSTDGSQELIAGYSSRHPELIKAFYHTKNQGVACTRTDALAAALGDYVTHVDGDDRFLPAKLEKEAKVLGENPDAQIAFSNFYYISAEGERGAVWAENEVPPQGDVFRQAFARDFPRGTLFRNEMVARSCFDRVGAYDPDLVTHEDWDLRIRLTKHFRVAYCPEPLAERRLARDGLSHSPAIRRLNSMKKVLEKNRSLLEDLPETDCVWIEGRLSTKFARLAWQATGEAMRRGEARSAFQNAREAIQYKPVNMSFTLAMRAVLAGWMRT
jgi:glycosyltransferase involved in cell wall biosynthesis